MQSAYTFSIYLSINLFPLFFQQKHKPADTMKNCACTGDIYRMIRFCMPLGFRFRLMPPALPPDISLPEYPLLYKKQYFLSIPVHLLQLFYRKYILLHVDFMFIFRKIISAKIRRIRSLPIMFSFLFRYSSSGFTADSIFERRS